MKKFKKYFTIEPSVDLPTKNLTSSDIDFTTVFDGVDGGSYLNFSINFLKRDNWMSKLIKIQKIFYGYNQKFENQSSLYLSFSKFPERLEKTHYIIEKLNL